MQAHPSPSPSFTGESPHKPPLAHGVGGRVDVEVSFFVANPKRKALTFKPVAKQFEQM